MKIDSHQHFWIFDPVRDAWIDESMQAIRGNFMPAMVEPLMVANRFSGCVAVQADQSEAETEFLLGLANTSSIIKGVVGWVDLLHPRVEERLEYFSGFPVIKGFRHLVQAEPEGFMDGTAFRKGISLLSKFGFTYDILIYPHQIEAATRLAETFPHQPFVVDHMAKPYIKNREHKNWSEKIKRLGALPNVYCKISGMVTEADLQHWKTGDFEPYVQTVLQAFGPGKCMFGSDWPVCNLAASYGQVTGVVSNLIASLEESEKTDIWYRAATRFYGLAP